MECTTCQLHVFSSRAVACLTFRAIQCMRMYEVVSTERAKTILMTRGKGIDLTYVVCGLIDLPKRKKRLHKKWKLNFVCMISFARL